MNRQKKCFSCDTIIYRKDFKGDYDYEHRKFCSMPCRGRYYKPQGNDYERFLSYTNKTTTCWIWTGKLQQGYGQIRVKGKTIRAYRYAYETLKGKVPEGLDLDHLCRNRACVNPEHLEPVTPLENKKRSPLWTGNRTHCKYGHEFTPENTYLRLTGGRTCRTCMKLYMRNKRHATIS